MMNIDNKLYLNLEIYTLSDIIKCIKAYDKAAYIEFRKDGRYYVCEFTQCKVDSIRTMREFENYLIYMSLGGRHDYL